MRFEILPNLFLLPTTEFNDWISEITPTNNANYVIAVNLSTTFNPDCTNKAGSNNKKNNQFFLLQNYSPSDPVASKKTMDIVGNAFFSCSRVFAFHDKNDMDSVEVFMADFMKRFAGAKSYKSDILDIVRLNLKHYTCA